MIYKKFFTCLLLLNITNSYGWTLWTVKFTNTSSEEIRAIEVFYDTNFFRCNSDKRSFIKPGQMVKIDAKGCCVDHININGTTVIDAVEVKGPSCRDWDIVYGGYHDITVNGKPYKRPTFQGNSI